MKKRRFLSLLLSAALLAGLLAYVVDKKYFHAAAFGGALAFCSFIGMIHAPSVALFPAESLPFGVVYLVAGAWLVAKGLLFRKPQAQEEAAAGRLQN